MSPSPSGMVGECLEVKIYSLEGTEMYMSLVHALYDGKSLISRDIRMGLRPDRFRDLALGML